MKLASSLNLPLPRRDIGTPCADAIGADTQGNAYNIEIGCTVDNPYVTLDHALRHCGAQSILDARPDLTRSPDTANWPQVYAGKTYALWAFAATNTTFVQCFAHLDDPKNSSAKGLSRLFVLFIAVPAAAGVAYGACKAYTWLCGPANVPASQSQVRMATRHAPDVMPEPPPPFGRDAIILMQLSMPQPPPVYAPAKQSATVHAHPVD